MSSTFVHAIFFGSDGAATRRFCTELQECGHIGKIAAALFHVQKSLAGQRRIAAAGNSKVAARCATRISPIVARASS